MTDIRTKIKKISKIAASAVLLFGIAFSATDATAAALSKNSYSPNLKISGLLPECTYPQKNGGGACLEKLNAQSCLNTTPFSPIGKGVSSEMCARGSDWCARNDPQKKHTRCQNVAKGIVKNHEGYDYSAACGTGIFAPCDGKITQCKTSGSSAGLYFKCDSATVCGKDIEFRFYHNSNCSKNGTYKKGQRIGAAGNVSGYPCHMHIEIRENGVLLDPMNPGFDTYVCGCQETTKVNRLNCFTGASDPAMDAVVDISYDNSLSYASADASGGYDESGVSQADCMYEQIAANYQQAGCFFCKPFRLIFNTASIMAKISFDSLSKSVMYVVVIAFAIWMAVTIMKFVSSFSIVEPRIMIKTLLNQAFRVLIVVIILNEPTIMQNVLSMTLDPVFSTGLKIAQLGGGLVSGEGPADCNLVASDGRTVIDTNKTDSSMVGQQLYNSGVNAFNVAVLDAKAKMTAVDLIVDDTKVVKSLGTHENLAVVGSDIGALSPELGNGIICTVKRVQDQIMDIMAISRISFCLAWEHAILWVIPHLGYLITGIIFFLTGFIMMMSYPFLLVDSIFNMAIAIALFPAALGAFAFKITAQYLDKIWKIFLNAIFTFIFLSLIILIISAIAKQYMTELITDDVKNNLVMSTIMWFTVGAAKLFFILFLGWAVLHEAHDMSSKFAENLDLNGLGSKTGSAFNAARKNLIDKPALKAAPKIGKIAKENLSHLARVGKHKFSESSFAQKLAAKDENGKIMTDDKGDTMYQDYSARGLWNSLRGRKTYRSYHRDASGNVRETLTTIKGKGKKSDGSFKETSRTIRTTDDFGSSTEVVNAADRSRSIIKQKSNMALNKLINKKGELDTETMNAFLQNSMMSEKEKHLMLVDQLVKSRLGNYNGGRLDDKHYQSRQISGMETDENGNKRITISQINEDGSKSTFTATFHPNNRVMTSVTTLNSNGKGYAYASDGIIQRKSIIDGDKVEHRYSVADYYSKATLRPVSIDGEVATLINKDNILFGSDDMKRFGEQVRKKGNKAYDFAEFIK